jgi:hypothetical protein
MGWWKSEHGVCGDGPADIMDAAFRKVEGEYLRKAGRLPTQGEMADLIEFCSCGTLVPKCGAAMHPFSKATVGDKDTPRAEARGRQGICGYGSKDLPPGSMINVDPATGTHYEAGEGEQVLMEQMREMAEQGGRVEGLDGEDSDGGGPDPEEHEQEDRFEGGTGRNQSDEWEDERDAADDTDGDE